MTDEIQHKIFKVIESDPNISQRELSELLGISLGKTNYCLKALIAKGWVKARNFKNSQNKLGYAYLLTPTGFEQKTTITVRYLKSKMREFDELKTAVEELKREVGAEKMI